MNPTDDSRQPPRDVELDQALARRPRHPAPAALRARIAERLPDAPPREPRPPEARRRPRTARLPAWLAPVASAFAAGVLVWGLTRPVAHLPREPEGAATEMVREAVNDHLRVTQSTHPLEVESGGIHQVKPWFTGRLDFAPRVDLESDPDFPLLGGGLGYFRDRKAAVFVFGHRLHKITLLVFPADQLPWRTEGLKALPPISVDEQTSRGFTVLLWREGELGYALVSDVSAADLERLAPRLTRR
jgi:anti-sigma factor RsiW